MNCSDVSEILGAYLDGEVAAQDAEAVRAHLGECERCREEFRRLQGVVQPLKATGDVKAPSEIWDGIEARLDSEEPTAIPISEGHRRDRDATSYAGKRTPSRWRLRPFLVAAAVFLPVAAALLFFQLPSSGPAYAEEAVIDFRPLLAGIETDYEGAIRDFLGHHKAREIDLSAASEILPVRVHPTDPMPEDLTLTATHLLTLGKKQGLLFEFSGPQGQLVVSQCPVGVKKVHGEHHCMPCEMGARPDAEAVHVGPWRLVHLPSEKGCICILSTLDDSKLGSVVKALRIEF